MGIFSSKKSKRKETIEHNRMLLQNDWRLITSVIVRSIRQHWDVLEDKFEQYVGEDDYGNHFIDNNFSKEIIYFSHKITLPEIDKLIRQNKVRQNSFALLPYPQSTQENLYGIRYSDSDDVIADKYVTGLLKDGRGYRGNDEFLYSIYDSTFTLENGSNSPGDKASLLELTMDGSLQLDKSMKVTFLAGIVFMLFYVMYSNKPSTTEPRKATPLVDFTGNNPYKYEEFIKKLLRDAGFSAIRTRGSGDYGVDVIASKNGKTYALQCKLYNHTVGAKAVQEIVSGRIFYRADFAIVVSDNSFTDAAKNLARKSDVILTHHKNLLHKMESLEISDNEILVHKSDQSVDGLVRQDIKKPVAKKQWAQDNADELITVILPTIDPKN